MIVPLKSCFDGSACGFASLWESLASSGLNILLISSSIGSEIDSTKKRYYKDNELGSKIKGNVLECVIFRYNIFVFVND